jgi:hypothetical protein
MDETGPSGATALTGPSGSAGLREPACRHPGAGAVTGIADRRWMGE